MVWEAVQKAYKDYGEGVGLLNFRVFQKSRPFRSEADILLISRELGLVVIEVKSCVMDNIDKIEAQVWYMKNFYAKIIKPFEQAEKQLFRILDIYNRKFKLKDRIPGRVIVALPNITRDDWIDRGFDPEHPICPPLIFGDDLRPSFLRNRIESQATILKHGKDNFAEDPEVWNLIQKNLLCPVLPKEQIIIPGIESLVKASKIAIKKPVLKVNKTPSQEPEEVEKTKPSDPVLARRGEALQKLRGWISDMDWQQVAIGLQIPPGPQRIRGIAGSGKTLLLCQKAVQMHLKYPEWRIALVFFTRSLYDLIPRLVGEWMQHLMGNEDPSHLKEEQDPSSRPTGELEILHAWGTKQQPGFYSKIRDACKVNAVTNQQAKGSINEKLAQAIKSLLETKKDEIKNRYDAILIDEGQDLVTGDVYKYEDKQAIYYLAWNALKPISEDQPDMRRLIWAYDEAQSLESLLVPSYGEVFGKDLGLSLSGFRSGPTYKGNIKKSEVMKKCYRTPGSILVAAHAMGMGLLRPEGMLRGYTKKQDWEVIGYEVEGEFRSGHTIKLHRPPEHSPNPMPTYWRDPLLEFERFSSREDQIAELIKRIQHNLDHDQLRPHQDILVILLGSSDERSPAQISQQSKNLHTRVCYQLKQAGIPYFVPGASGINQYPSDREQDRNVFWADGAITVSRIHRAKGHEAAMVYVLGLEFVAQQEANIILRNQLFVALTRSLGWVYLSGMDPSLEQTQAGQTWDPFYQELQAVIQSDTTLEFTYTKAPPQTLTDGETEEENLNTELITGSVA